MTGRVAIATAHWRRLDREGTDRCMLSRLDQGWMLVGQAIWHEDGRDAALTYDLRCDPDWNSLSADVTGTVAGRDLALRIRHSGDGWLLNEVLQPDTVDCSDLDLSFTPATNILPLRRVSVNADADAPVRAAWLPPALDHLAPLYQSYRRLAGDRVLYTSLQYQAELHIHETGFVIRYPDLWEGWVDV